MKYVRMWLTKQLSRSYERSRLKGLTETETNLEIEKFIDENRKRIQDLELIVKEMAQKWDQLKQESGRF
jgi:hypothetical protein